MRTLNGLCRVEGAEEDVPGKKWWEEKGGGRGRGYGGKGLMEMGTFGWRFRGYVGHALQAYSDVSILRGVRPDPATKKIVGGSGLRNWC